MKDTSFKISGQMGQALGVVFALVIFLGLSTHFVFAQTGSDQEISPAATPTSLPPDPPVETPALADPQPADTPTPEPDPTVDLAASPDQESGPDGQDRETLLRQAAGQAFRDRLSPEQVFEVGLTKIVDAWAFVNFRVRSTDETEAEPRWDVAVALARWDEIRWQVALEDTPEFVEWLDQIPDELISAEARPYLDPTRAIAANAPGLWLPFPVGQTWKYLAGPHGGPGREAVDFGPFRPGERPGPDPTPAVPLTGRERDVTAAAAGVVIDRMANVLILRHGSSPAWETGYASLAAASNIRRLGEIIHQGERIGAASIEGDSTQDHVHFWVRRGGVNQIIDGQVLSEWRIYQDNGYEVGHKAGRIVYKDGTEKVDCRTVERAGLASEYCHVKHFSVAPSPLPTTTVRLVPLNPFTIPVGLTGLTSVVVDNATNLYHAHVRLSYTPATSVTVVDAFPGTPGIQVAPGGVFSDTPFAIIQNEVRTDTGVIEFEAELQVPTLAFTGSNTLIEITWQGLAPGLTTVRLDQVRLADPNDRSLSVITTTATTSSTIRIQSEFMAQGQVELQGKNDWSGVTVATSQRQVQTDPTGHFSLSLAGDHQVTLTKPGYLSAQAQGNPTVGVEIIDLGRVSLLGGEVTGDDQIDIFDMAFIASRYGSSDTRADINGDGSVDIFDLTLSAANYGQHGPITAWR